MCVCGVGVGWGGCAAVLVFVCLLCLKKITEFFSMWTCIHTPDIRINTNLICTDCIMVSKKKKKSKEKNI